MTVEAADGAEAAELTIEDTGLAGAEPAEAGALAEAEEPVEAWWLVEAAEPVEADPFDGPPAEGLEPVEAPESPCELPELTDLTCEDAADTALWATFEAAEPTACTAPLDDDGAEGVVSAWACWREKSTIRIRIPAASNPACTARRAILHTVARATRVLPTVGVAYYRSTFHHGSALYTTLGRFYQAISGK